MDFSIAKRSGLRQKGELDSLFGVSYPMINAYLNGKSYPRGANRIRIERALTVLQGLITAEKLPFSEDKSSEARMKAIDKMKAIVSAKK